MSKNSAFRGLILLQT